MSKVVPGVLYSFTTTLERPQSLDRGTHSRTGRQTAYAHRGDAVPVPEALQSLLCMAHCASGRGQQEVVTGVPTTGTNVQRLHVTGPAAML